MGKLLKYEIQKSKLMLLVTAIIIGLLEVFWLIGYAGVSATEDSYGIFDMIFIFATIFLVFAAVLSMFIGALYSVTLYNHDIHKKSGYMLLLTPTPTWKWVLSKVLLGFAATTALMLVFAVLGITDIFLVIDKTDPETLIGAFLIPLKSLVMNHILEWTLVLLNIIFEIVAMVTTIFLAIAMARTLLGNKKIGGFIAFLFWIGLNVVQTVIASVILLVSDDAMTIDVEMTSNGLEYVMSSFSPVFLLSLALNIVFSGICYFVTVYLTDKKMSF